MKSSVTRYTRATIPASGPTISKFSAMAARTWNAPNAVRVKAAGSVEAGPSALAPGNPSPAGLSDKEKGLDAAQTG